MIDRGTASILMPVYNSADTVERAINSILSQTYRNLELIVVDDGSTDQTATILEHLCARDQRIFLLQSVVNEGVTRALVKALEFASGEFVFRQDADDFSDPERIEKQIQLLSKYSLVFCGIHSSRFRLLSILKSELLFTGVYQGDILRFGNIFAHGCMGARKSLLRQVGGYDPSVRYAQDYDLWSRLACQSKAPIFYFLNEPLYTLGIGGGRISDKFSELQVRSAETTRSKFFKAENFFAYLITKAGSSKFVGFFVRRIYFLGCRQWI